MTSFLLKSGPAVAGVLGILLFALAITSAWEIGLLCGSILFGSAVVAAPLGRIAEKIGT